MLKRMLNGVRIAIHDEKHCSDKCPLFVAEQGTCVLLKGTQWCLGYDRYGSESLLAEGHYLRCKKCLRLEAQETAKVKGVRPLDFEMFLEWCRRHDTLVDECPIDVSKLELHKGSK